MEFIELSKSQRMNIYNKYMLKDFHKSEVKPFDLIEGLINDGCYKCYGFFEDEHLLGYAYFIEARGSILMDYLAVSPEYRSRGFGSKFLKVITSTFKDKYNSLLGEVENPRFSLGKDDKINRERRISFYLKNDFKVSNIESRVADDQYTIIKLTLDKELDDKEIYKEVNTVYKTIFSEEYFKNNINVSVCKL